MAMTDTPVSSCPPIAESDSSFTSLGAIDRIGDAFCQAAQDPRHIADVQHFREFRMRCLETTLAIVDACRIPDQATVSVRLKRLDSIRRKIDRADTDFTLGRLDDVVGVRVICEDLSAIREYSTRIQDSLHFYRLKDYISEPAATGYRGIHHIMRFQQPVSPKTELPMRFEIQVRTYLQHRWAVWSESHGEAVKLGTGDTEKHDRLRAHSEKIAQWETDNPNTRQTDELSDYSGGRSIAVCWRPPHGPAITHFFEDEVQEAVDWLNRLEANHPAERENALLLVGVASDLDRQKLTRMLRLTHPLYSGARVPDPEYWTLPSPS